MAQFQAKEIGGRIAQARLEAGMTQEELAEIAPFSKRSLQDYEMGVTIPYRHMRDLGKLLNKPIAWFLHGDAPEGAAPANIGDRLDDVFQLLDAIDRKLDVRADRLEAIEDALRELRRDLQRSEA